MVEKLTTIREIDKVINLNTKMIDIGAGTRDFLNLDIDYYVRVNFFSVKDINGFIAADNTDVYGFEYLVKSFKVNLNQKKMKLILMKFLKKLEKH